MIRYSIHRLYPTRTSKLSKTTRLTPDTFGIDISPPLGCFARDIAPANLLGVSKDARLDGFVFAGRRHVFIGIVRLLG